MFYVKDFRVIMLIPKTLLHWSKKLKTVFMETLIIWIPPAL